MFEVDESQWPIVSVRWIGVAADHELTELFARIDGWLARGQRFGLLLDSRSGTGTLTATQRRALVGHMKQNAELGGRLMIQAIVHDQVIHRALYSLVSALNPLPFPSKTFPDDESARLWLRSKLDSLRG